MPFKTLLKRIKGEGKEWEKIFSNLVTTQSTKDQYLDNTKSTQNLIVKI